MTLAQNLGTGTKRNPTQCRTMALDIVNEYISLVSRFFVLSKVAIMAPEAKNGIPVDASIPPLRLPENSHSLCTAYHIQHIFGEVQDCVNEIMALDISEEVRSGLTSLMDNLKWRFVDVLTDAWVRGAFYKAFYSRREFIKAADAAIFYHLETWIACWDASSSSTRYLVFFELYQKHIMTATYRIATGGETLKNTSHIGISQELMVRITNAAFESIHKFLDGLVLLASEDSPVVQNPIIAEGEGSMEMSLHELGDLKDAVRRCYPQQKRPLLNNNSSRIIGCLSLSRILRDFPNRTCQG